MKKGLLLSVVASGILFAGGDIAPATPVSKMEMAPAACNFWGNLVLRYDAIAQEKKSGSKIISNTKFTDMDTNEALLALAMGVEHKMGYGFSLGAEAAAKIQGNGKLKKRKELAELSQLYLTYTFGNTAIKFGRQALPKKLSPWAWSDRTAGILDTTYNSLVVANTSFTNTTLVGAWVHSYNMGFNSTLGNVKIADNKGLFMLAGQYTGISDTALRASLYYKPKGKMDGAGDVGTGMSGWLSAETKMYGMDLGLQGVYASIDTDSKTFGGAAYVGGSYGSFDAKLTLAYLNDGSTTLSLGDTSAFWGYSSVIDYGPLGGDIIAEKQLIAHLQIGYDFGKYGKLYAAGAYDKQEGDNKVYGGVVGYKFKIADLNAKVEYRYTKQYREIVGGAPDIINQRIRVQGVYKF